MYRNDKLEAIKARMRRSETPKAAQSPAPKRQPTDTETKSKVDIRALQDQYMEEWELNEQSKRDEAELLDQSQVDVAVKNIRELYEISTCNVVDEETKKKSIEGLQHIISHLGLANSSGGKLA